MDELQIRVTYEDGGAETQLTVQQHNFMHDDDTNLPAEAMVVAAPLIMQLNSDAMTTIEQLVANAQRRNSHQLVDAAERCRRDRFPHGPRCRVGRPRGRAE